ncbi:unnamed protein product [Cylicocyclus nassatus]|uniref:Uncharacterized protein n=1 Tax=Cylicocyclus nassatus TaxID=53992 RepID=A0AA36MA28_CYLNA|nr:unnamed protein product [Cylicocyclus nassatus]
MWHTTMTMSLRSGNIQGILDLSSQFCPCSRASWKNLCPNAGESTRAVKRVERRPGGRTLLSVLDSRRHRAAVT